MTPQAAPARRGARVAIGEIEELFGAALSRREIARGGPSWLTFPLIASEAAREKLRAWIEATPRPWETPDEGAILSRARLFGDVETCRAVAAMLATLPPPVVAYCIERCAFLCIGMRWIGTCGALPDVGGAVWQIVVTPGRDGSAATAQATGAHEVAHCWTLPEPTASAMPASVAWAAQTATEAELDAAGPEARQHVEKLRDQHRHERREYLARALAHSWGFDPSYEPGGIRRFSS